MSVHLDTASSLGMALVMSSITPLVLLDEALVVRAASRSFCRSYGLDPATVIGKSIFALGSGEWNMPRLRSLLEATAAGLAAIDAYEIDLASPGAGVRNLVLSAHKLSLPKGDVSYIALAVSDVTDARIAERVKDDLVRDKKLLLTELQHRVANSLQIIASVLMQSVRRAQSEETRSHLRDAHHRVMSIATLQRQLAQSDSDQAAIGPYFTDLCNSIGASMIGDPSEIALAVHTDASVTSSGVSVSLGLIVTELVINCLKHAFPIGTIGGEIVVDYRATEDGWRLSVADNGVGMPLDGGPGSSGLGTGIVNALARQLDADVVVADNSPGTSVQIIHTEKTK